MGDLIFVEGSLRRHYYCRQLPNRFFRQEHGHGTSLWTKDALVADVHGAIMLMSHSPSKQFFGIDTFLSTLTRNARSHLIIDKLQSSQSHHCALASSFSAIYSVRWLLYHRIGNHWKIAIDLYSLVRYYREPSDRERDTHLQRYLPSQCQLRD